MPEYTYKCNDCDKKFILVCSISQYKEQINCEYCNSLNTNRSYEDDLITLNACVKKSDNELKTIGDLAQRNSDRMSNDQKAELWKKHNEYKDEEFKKPLPTGMSRVKKGPKIKWPGTDGSKKRRKLNGK